MIGFSTKSNPKPAVKQFLNCLTAGLLFISLAACDSAQNQNLRTLDNNERGFTTTTNLQLDGITTPVTLRVTISRDGTVVSDEVQNYEENWINSAAGTIPVNFSKSYELSYEPHAFDFAVYYCNGDSIASVADLETAISDGSAVLLGAASQDLTIDKFEEDLPLVTINIAEGDAISDTLMFFSAEPAFAPETISTSSCTTSAGQYSSIALDSNGDAHVSFLCQVSSSANRLGYVYQSDSTWQTPWVLSEDNNSDGTTDSIGEYSNIAIDSSDDIHFSYYDASNGDARYTSIGFGDSAFSSSELAASGTVSRSEGKYMTMALYESDGISYPYISLQRYANSTQSYATFTNDLDSDGNWSALNVNSLPQIGNGKFTAIAFGNDDRFHMSYLYRTGTSSTYYLGYTSCPYNATTRSQCDTIIHNGSSGTTSIKLSSTVEQNTAIAIDSQNYTHILYYDYTNGDLKHAYGHYSTSAWTVETITDGAALAGAGQYSAIAIDSSDKIHIAYYDADTQTLQYKQGESGDAWTSVTPIPIDSNIGTGKFVSLKLDENNATLHLAYYDETNKTLKYAIGE